MTNKKRRDSKNRLLHTGESQLSDGRYMYRYYDMYGNRKKVYSWQLVATDLIPAGAKATKPLRELIAEINADKAKGIDTFSSKNTTINEQWDCYLKEKYLKESTKCNYIYLWDKYIRNTLGQIKISNLTAQIVMNHYLMMYNDLYLSEGTISAIHNLISPVFCRCIDNDLLSKNYATRAMKTIRNIEAKKAEELLKLSAQGNDSESTERVILSPEQEAAFVKFLETDKRCKKWKNLFIVLIKTGARVSEICGLTSDDVDLINGVIKIRRNVLYFKINNKCRFFVSTLKTKAGVRDFPIYCEELKNALEDELSKYSDSGAEIDGVSGWLFRNRYGQCPLKASNCNDGLKRTIAWYNESVEDKLKIKNFSCHNFRHTFISRCATCGVANLVTKAIVGHEPDKNDVTNRYTHLSLDYIKEEISKLEKNNLKIKRKEV